MPDARPRSVISSQFIQILLLGEPIWRAVRMNSVSSLIGTCLFCLAATGLILLATRLRKAWARDVLAGIALTSLVSCLIALVISFWHHEMNEFVALPAILVIFINFLAVAMLFTDSADKWFAAHSHHEN